ncbi:hypothetical protein [Pedobacter nanyangensis]|uniref:hypothetical protein n=1 Tax=Pedobacter nanyangensis TaxID=1562389 RepID=UPI0019637CB1|nr:hypothetical protein [Pedobacter nanyangensis]
MEMTVLKPNADLQKFIDKFEPTKFKLIKNGIEIRGIIDLNRGIQEAKALIERFQLRLIISHTAEMLSYRGFEVNYFSEEANIAARHQQATAKLDTIHVK